MRTAGAAIGGGRGAAGAGRQRTRARTQHSRRPTQPRAAGRAAALLVGRRHGIAACSRACRRRGVPHRGSAAAGASCAGSPRRGCAGCGRIGQQSLPRVVVRFAFKQQLVLEFGNALVAAQQLKMPGEGRRGDVGAVGREGGKS
eukprot:357569-Chlamydomonas_euryale.AAC.2